PREGQSRRVPAVGARAPPADERPPELAADFRPRDPLRLIFVKARSPLAGEIVAGRRGHLLRARSNHDRRCGGDTGQCCDSEPSGRRHAPPPPALGSASFFMITLTSVGLIR